ncbi:MAG: hypothetical protein NTU49_03540 [Gammaproteobacteria bacterium]|nr:hypothetical protein [Gammaproteobacteria bacterium]
MEMLTGSHDHFYELFFLLLSGVTLFMTISLCLATKNSGRLRLSDSLQGPLDEMIEHEFMPTT